MTSGVEVVEKARKRIFGRDAEESDLIEYASIIDLLVVRGQLTPEDIVPTGQKGFSYRLVKLISENLNA